MADITNQMIRNYVRKVHKIPNLKRNEETHFVKKAIQGNENAKKRLKEFYLKLVLGIALKHFGKNRAELLDLIQEGNVAVCELVNKIGKWEQRKEGKGTIFGYYLTLYIKNRMIKYFPEKMFPIKIPHTTYHNAKSGYKPTAKWALFNLDQVKLVQNVSSIEEMEEMARKRDDVFEIEETRNVPLLEQIDKKILQKRVNGAVNQLNPRRQKVIKLKFGLDSEKENTNQEIADLLGFSFLSIQNDTARSYKILRKLLHRDFFVLS